MSVKIIFDMGIKLSKGCEKPTKRSTGSNDFSSNLNIVFWLI